MTYPNDDFSAEALIDAHPQAELIRRVQRSAYRAYSRRHKLGLDAASWLVGPLAMVAFSMVDQHRDHCHAECITATERLLAALGQSVADRRIVALLLTDYPGRSSEIAGLLHRFLNDGTAGISP